MPDSRNWFAPVPPHRRRLCEPVSRRGVLIETEGRTLLNFAANDYLGLAFHPRVLEAAAKTIQQEGLGSGASRLISGDHPILHELERELSKWKGFEAALFLGSGMLANLGLLDALAGRDTHLFCDRLNHASLVDGVRLCRGRMHRFPHLDYAGLKRLLAAHPGSRKIIVSDGVFSMDGDCADVRALLSLADLHDALLVLDDAHGLGVLDSEGRGLTAAAGVQGHPRLVEVVTCGKALGAYGAFVLGSNELIAGLRQRLRTLFYSTALPPCLAAAVLVSLHVLREEKLTQRLRENIGMFRTLAEQYGLPIKPSVTAIQPFLLGNDESALRASERLREAGFHVPAIRPPTVPEGTARLRITLSAVHTETHITRLVEALDALGRP